MSDKRKRPVTGKLITSGLRSGFLEMGTSPTTPLEFQVLSPTGIINCEMGRVGIGLGIVVALDKSNENIPVKKSNFRKKVSIFDISPARFGDDDKEMCKASEFLSSCNLCNKRLHGKDIYMYRGDKAFCSSECRSKQIGMDERVEKQCSSQASSSPSNATSSHLLATGIFVI